MSGSSYFNGIAIGIKTRWRPARFTHPRSLMAAFPDLRQAARRSVFSGSCASVGSAIALGLRSRAEGGSAAGPLNGPSQWLWGEDEAHARDLTLRHTAVGYAIHHLSANLWAVLYETVSGDKGTHKPTARILAEAAGVTAFAFAVDYGLTPRRLQPGFEKHVSPFSVALGYAAFAMGLAASTLLRRAAQDASSLKGKPESISSRVGDRPLHRF
jgi:hypothetical protein